MHPMRRISNLLQEAVMEQNYSNQSDIRVIENFLDHIGALAHSDPNAPPNAVQTLAWMHGELDKWREEYREMMAGYKAGGGPAAGMHDALRDMWRQKQAGGGKTLNNLPKGSASERAKAAATLARWRKGGL